MTDSKTDVSKWMDIVAKLCTILIPVILFYFGNEIKKSQDADNKEQQNYNRVTTLLKSLSSDNALERRLAVSFAQGLANSGDFPPELLSVITAVSSTDSALSKQADKIINTLSQKAIASNDTSAQQQIKQAVASSPVKVYIQIPRSFDINEAKQLYGNLKNQGYNMFGIEHVDTSSLPQNNEVRFFKRSDAQQAGALSDYINNTGNFQTKAKYIPGYENKITGSQLEIWLR